MRLRKEMLDKMTEEERLALYLRERDEAILSNLHDLSQKIDQNRHTFLSDFGANIAGNAAWDSFVWLAGRLIKKL